MRRGIRETIGHGTIRAINDTGATGVLDAWNRFFILDKVSNQLGQMNSISVDTMAVTHGVCGERYYALGGMSGLFTKDLSVINSTPHQWNMRSKTMMLVGNGRHGCHHMRTAYPMCFRLFFVLERLHDIVDLLGECV